MINSTKISQNTNSSVENSATKNLLHSVQKLANFYCELKTYDENERKQFYQLFMEMHSNIESCEKCGFSKEQILSLLQPVREIFSTKLMQRLNDWPRGYQGDFESIDLLYYKKNNYQPGTGQWFIENVVFEMPIVQQHRNKVFHQAKHIREAIKKNNNAKIAVLACGGGIDLTLVLNEIAQSNAKIYINDQDQDAIDLTLSRCQKIRDKIIPLKMDIVHAVKKLHFEKDIELVLAGGVFDYLNDKIASLLVRRVYGLLVDNGKFFYTNVAAGNPFRLGMEYILNWQLIERSDDEIKTFCAAGKINEKNLHIQRDETGLTMLIELIKRNSN